MAVVNTPLEGSRKVSTCTVQPSGSRFCLNDDSNFCVPKGRLAPRLPVVVIQTTSVPGMVDPINSGSTASRVAPVSNGKVGVGAITAGLFKAELLVKNVP